MEKVQSEREDCWMDNVPRKHQMLVCRMTLVIKKWKRVRAEARWKVEAEEK